MEINRLLRRIPGLWSLRTSGRDAFVRAFCHTLQLPEARSQLARALQDQNVVGPVPPLGGLLRNRPYADLPNPAQARSRPAVFVTGRFRSGSTLVWNLFRHTPGVTAYYEPLNERRWFDPSTRMSRTDPTHLGVKDYWTEYDGLGELAAIYDEAWTYRHLYMAGDAWAPRLKRYIDVLIERAPGVPVLQFNRVDFRLPWLRRHYPEARLIHIFRHPRDQWLSTLGRHRPDMRTLTMAAFKPYDGFYLQNWGRDLALAFPFIAIKPDDHPYELFFQLWRLSYLFGLQYADESFAFEDMLANPPEAVTRLMTLSGIEEYPVETLASLVEPVGTGKWRSLPGSDVLETIEARVEAQLADYFGMRPHAPQSLD